MDEEMAGWKPVLPVPDKHRNQAESNDQKHCRKSRSAKVLAARLVPGAKSHKGNQLDRAGVFRQHAQADQETGQDPESEPGLVFCIPESEGGKSPEEDINGVDGHQRGADREERRQRRQQNRPESDPVRKQSACQEEDSDSGTKRQERRKETNPEYRLTKKGCSGRDEPGDNGAFVKIADVRVPGP